MGRHRLYKERKYVVGQQLLALRTRAQLTQAELATLAGISRRSIQNWENGETYPKEEGLQQLIAVFLTRSVFTVGHERAEAEALWEQISQEAPHRLASFDTGWFTDLLVRQKLATSALDHNAPQAGASRHNAQIPLIDWGEAPDVPVLYGRQAELDILEQWVQADRCRVVALLGLGGIGKTSVAIRFAHHIADQFDVVFFRSLRHVPPLSPLLDNLIRAASAQEVSPPDDLLGKIMLFVQLCRTKRCLIVLDNLEAIIQEGINAGDYRAGYTDYGMLIQRLGEIAHQSCLLLTSREKPAELGQLEGETAPVRILMLGGLTEEACQTILEDKDIAGTTLEYAALARLYGGNPLALRLLAEPIHELFGGEVKAFLSNGEVLFNGVGKLLEQQVGRASPLEQVLLNWLAIEREPVALNQLVADLAEPAHLGEILAALESLRRRSLIERVARGATFTLQPVVMEYLTTRLIDDVNSAIARGTPELLTRYALVQATNRNYVRHSQEQLIATAVLEQAMAASGGSATIEFHLIALLGAWRNRPTAEQGYGPGNVINLLRLLRGNLRGFDFSDLAFRQAYLQEVEAQDTRFVNAHFSESVFADAFDYGVCVALSADGAYLAAGTASGEVQLWRLADRVLMASIQAHAGGIYGIALSADGRLIVSGSVNGTIKLWSADSGVILAVLRGHTGTIHSLALSSDGQTIASASFDGTARLWSSADGQSLATLYGHAGLVWGVSLSANGQLVATASSDGTIRLWAADSGLCVATLNGHHGGVWSVALSADGRRAASGGVDGTVRLWDTSSGACLTILQGHTDMVWSVAISADGRLVASGTHDGTVRLWNADSGICLAVLQEHVGGICGVALNGTGRIIASTSFDGTIRLWDVEGGRHRSTLRGHTGLVWDVALSADGRLVASVGIEGVVRLWEASEGRLLATLQGHGGTVHSVALAADGQLLASGSFDGTIRLWDVAGGRHRATLRAHTGLVWSVALSADGRLMASGGGDGTVRLWAMQSEQLLTTFTGHSGAVRAVALTADGQLLASGSFDGTIRLWDVAGGRHRATLRAHTGLVWSVALSADGRLMASGGGDGTVRLWAVHGGQLLATLTGHNGAVFRVALSADGQLVASSGMDGTIRLWQVADNTLLWVVQAHTGAVWGMTLSADGRLIAGGGRDGMVGLWETDSGTAVGMLRPDRPYERMDITNLTGVTEAQRAALKALGAVEQSESATAPTGDRATEAGRG